MKNYTWEAYESNSDLGQTKRLILCQMTSEKSQNNHNNKYYQFYSQEHKLYLIGTIVITIKGIDDMKNEKVPWHSPCKQYFFSPMLQEKWQGHCNGFSFLIVSFGHIIIIIIIWPNYCLILAFHRLIKAG